jgi:hypothetical protein
VKSLEAEIEALRHPENNEPLRKELIDGTQSQKATTAHTSPLLEQIEDTPPSKVTDFKEGLTHKELSELKGCTSAAVSNYARRTRKLPPDWGWEYVKAQKLWYPLTLEAQEKAEKA